MLPKQLQQLVLQTLEEYKALDIVDLEITELSPIADYMIICTGTSKRHVQTLADQVITQAKAAGVQVLGTEGVEFGEWVLVDLGDVVVHAMLATTREFYSLEKLWMTTQTFRERHAN